MNRPSGNDSVSCPWETFDNKETFSEFLTSDECRPSSSPWASPLHLVPRRNVEWRICGDYRHLYKKTVQDKYPVLFVQDVSTILYGETIFSKLDLYAACNQIPIALKDISKIVVITRFGLCEYTVITFGLRNVGQMFQCYLHLALGDLLIRFSVDWYHHSFVEHGGACWSSSFRFQKI